MIYKLKVSKLTDDLERQFVRLLPSAGIGLKLGVNATDYAIKENPAIKNEYIHFVPFGIDASSATKKPAGEA